MENQNIINEEKGNDVNHVLAVVTINSLLELLAMYGGKIVSTNSLDVDDINQARASNRMYVDENFLGYVWMPNIKDFPTTEEEVIFFEKWYPLEIEVPKEVTERMLERIFNNR